MSLTANATAGDLHALMLHGTAAGTGSGFAARSATGGTDKQSFKSQSLSTSDVYAITGVWSASNDRTIYVNGVAGTANTNTLAPTIDRFDLGARFDGGSHQEGLTANLYMPTIWNVALTADQVYEIGRDISGAGDGPWLIPRAVRRDAIVFHDDLERESSTSVAFQAWAGGTITPVNAPAIGVTFPVSRPLGV